MNSTNRVMNEAILKLVLLWGFYLTYMVLGAFIFMELEYENERALVSDFKETLQELNLTRNLSRSLINDLSDVYRKAYAMGIDLHEGEHSKWDMAGSFYFVGTVLTTIGFGLTAPITISGQVFFLIYSLLGIPLNVLLFNTLLDQTVHLLSYILGRIHRFCRKGRNTINITPRPDSAAFWEPSTVTLSLVSMFTVTLIVLITAPLFVYLENWSFFESVYFAVVTYTTVGFGDFVPGGVHTETGQNVSPHYRVGNWFVIFVGTIFMYTATALMASVYKQCLEYAITNCQKCRECKTGRNRIRSEPQIPSTPPVSERRPSTFSPLRDERKRMMAQLVLQNWRAKKKNHIGPVNTVEASILKSRFTNNEDHVTSTVTVAMDALSALSSDNNDVMSSNIKGQTSVEELSTIEAKLTNEFNQLIRDIQERRETLIKNEEKGIENGIAIMILSPDNSRSCCSSQLSPNGEDSSSIVVANRDL